MADTTLLPIGAKVASRGMDRWSGTVAGYGMQDRTTWGTGASDGTEPIYIVVLDEEFRGYVYPERTGASVSTCYVSAILAHPSNVRGA